MAQPDTVSTSAAASQEGIHFCHLHVHSQYSILDASLSIPALVAKAKADGMIAVALTDHGNLFGTVEFYKAAKGAGIKPIIGCEIGLTLGSRFEKKKSEQTFHITLLAQTTEGYKNLCKLSSYAFTEGFYYVPRIDMELLKKHSKGIICLSGCTKSPFANAILSKNDGLFEELVDQFIDIFQGNFYFELQRHISSKDDLELDGVLDESWLFQQYQDHVANQKKIEEKLLDTAKKRGIKYVATNNCHYGEREEWRAHEVLLNVQSGEPCQIWNKDPVTGQMYSTLNPKRSTFPSHEYYFKSTLEMANLFEDLPEALQTSVEIAKGCSVELDFVTKHYPVFYPPTIADPKNCSQEDRVKAVEDFLRKLAEDGIGKRYTPERLAKVKEIYPDKEPMEVIRSRLEYEFGIITSKGMADYLLIVWDFINWAKRNGIPMGPGRGSGAGSIILYLIGITDIEPLRFHLFFERFINPERLSYPDIDVDICMDRRPEVIEYTINKYGKDNVAQIITFGTMKAKMSVKDVGRALNTPLTKVNMIAKLIPEDLNITIEKALEKDPDLLKLYETDEEANRIISVAKTLEGSIRNTGIHAAGLIVSGEPLVEHIPVAVAKDSDMCVTQYSMKPVESVGMLKIDFLGLKTLTSIQMAIDAIKARTGKSIDWVNLNLDDPGAFNILNQGKTLGIFQMESGGMQDLARQLHLDKFEEIIAVLSLYRPGPMDMIPSFIARKHGREPIEYDHPWMESILKETYGIMVYQEQVMQIASRLANYSLGEGDVLRRAMGKKDAKEMAKQRDKFTQGALKNEIDEATATIIFDKMEKFAEYGFNKSHAAAYGFLTYVTAYLKANYPGEWLSALMTCDKDDTAKVSKFMHEALLMHIPCLPPDINESGLNFTFTGSGIRFALSAIKGVGTQVVEAIIEERQRKGDFTSLSDFIHRVDTKKVGKKVIELLIEAGCFDRFHLHRDELIVSIESLYDQAVRDAKDKQSGILSLFGSGSDTSFGGAKKADLNKDTSKNTSIQKRSREELLFKEKLLLGLFVSGHPLHEYKVVLDRIGCITISDATHMPDGTVFRLAFVIETVDTKISSKNQKKFAILKISDTSEEVLEVPIWSEMYETYQPILHENMLLWGIFSKEKRMGSDESQISCRWLGEIKKVDVKQVEESEAVYDKVKAQINRAKQFQQNGAKKSEKESSDGSNDQAKQEKKNQKKEEAQAQPEQSPPVRFFEIVLDLEKVRASHIISLDEMIRSSPGEMSVEVKFTKSGTEIAGLQLSHQRLINPSEELSQTLSSIPSCLSVQVSERVKPSSLGKGKL